MLEMSGVAARAMASSHVMAPSHVGPKAAKSIRRRLRRRVSRPTEVEFKWVLMARVGSSPDWQRLHSIDLDGVTALRVSTSQGPPSGQWLRCLLSVPGEGARCYDGAINNFLQDCRMALQKQKPHTAPDNEGAEPRCGLESSQATDPDDQAAEMCPDAQTPLAKIGRDAFILESDSEAEATPPAPSHEPQEQQRPLRKKRSGSKRLAKSESSVKKRRAAAGWATVVVRAREMRLHFDEFETIHVPATQQSVDMLLAELSSRKGERRRKKNSIVAQRSSGPGFRMKTWAEWRGAHTRGRCLGRLQTEVARRPRAASACETRARRTKTWPRRKLSSSGHVPSGHVSELPARLLTPRGSYEWSRLGPREAPSHEGQVLSKAR